MKMTNYIYLTENNLICLLSFSHPDNKQSFIEFEALIAKFNIEE